MYFFLNSVLLFVNKLRTGSKTAINVAINPVHLHASVFRGSTSPFLRMPSWPFQEQLHSAFPSTRATHPAH